MGAVLIALPAVWAKSHRCHGPALALVVGDSGLSGAEFCEPESFRIDARWSRELHWRFGRLLQHCLGQVL